MIATIMGKNYWVPFALCSIPLAKTENKQDFFRRISWRIKAVSPSLYFEYTLLLYIRIFLFLARAENSYFSVDFRLKIYMTGLMKTVSIICAKSPCISHNS